MISYQTLLMKFESKGEKTGWTYIELPAHLAQKILKNNKKSFRVKGYFDKIEVQGLSTIPMGDGNFIIALNAGIRKKIYKEAGVMLDVQLEHDKEFVITIPEDLYVCLEEERLIDGFEKLAKSHQNYFINWINSAKTEATRTKRIMLTVDAMTKGWDYGQMIRADKAKRK